MVCGGIAYGNHCMRASRRRGVSGFPTCGRYALIPNSLSIVHSLSTYTVVMCSWRRYGSFYSCSCPIVAMRKSHKAVLSGERNRAVIMLFQGANSTGSSNCSRCSSNYCLSSTGPSCTVWKH
jgi:hypothetical protein